MLKSQITLLCVYGYDRPIIVVVATKLYFVIRDRAAQLQHGVQHICRRAVRVTRYRFFYSTSYPWLERPIGEVT